jgi:hypothetical protein
MSTSANPVSHGSRYPRLTIRLPQWLLSNLKDQAAADGTTTSDLVRAAVIDHLDCCHAIGDQAPGTAAAPEPFPMAAGVVITA